MRISPYLYTPQVTFSSQPPSEVVIKGALGKLKQITKSEYDLLTELEKTALRSKCREFCADVNNHNIAAEIIKKVLDAQYGKDRWVALLIGRSLSSIGKMLALKIGEDRVKNLPMSGMRISQFGSDMYEYYQNGHKKLTESAGYQKYKNYLNSIGLSKENIQSSDKTFVLMDYCTTGWSLKNAFGLLSSDDFWGTDKNVTFADIENITNCVENSLGLGEILDCSGYKDYALVSECCPYFENIPSAKGFLNKPKVKLFGFALMDKVFSNKNDEVKSLEFNTYKKPGKTLWLTPENQSKQDIYKDTLNIFNLTRRLERPGNEAKFFKSKIEQTINKTNSRLKDEAIKRFKANFPLEYECYLNIKDFYSLTDCLPTRTIKELEPVFALDKDYEPFFRLFEESLNLKKSDNESFLLINDYNYLQKARKDMEFYKENLDPQIYSDIQKRTKEISHTYSEEHIKNILTKVEKEYADILEGEALRENEFLARLDEKIKAMPNAEDAALKGRIELQSKALKRARADLLPF